MVQPGFAKLGRVSQQDHSIADVDQCSADIDLERLHTGYTILQADARGAEKKLVNMQLFDRVEDIAVFKHLDAAVIVSAENKQSPAFCVLLDDLIHNDV